MKYVGSISKPVQRIQSQFDLNINFRIKRYSFKAFFLKFVDNAHSDFSGERCLLRLLSTYSEISFTSVFLICCSVPVTASLDQFELRHRVAPEIEDIEGLVLHVQDNPRRPLEGRLEGNPNHSDKLGGR